MARYKIAAMRAGFEALYFSGAHMWLRPFSGGCGGILMLHHVRPPRLERFQPNRLLEVTPAFFEDVIRRIRRSNIEIVSMDEVHRRLTTGDAKRRFVAITFDDGYRDNRTWAYPILKKYNVPFTLYVPTSFPDRIGELWWIALEHVIAKSDRIGLAIDGQDRWFDCSTISAKYATFDYLYRWLRELPSEQQLRAAVRDLASRYGVVIEALCEDLCMTWEEIAEIADDPLVTIGAHTVNHFILHKASEKLARAEMQMGRAVIEAALGVRAEHFAYPVGDRSAAGPREFAIARELGYKTAVTTRPGMLFAEHRECLTALPRLSLNGEYQRMRYARVLLSGAATGVWNRFRRVDAA
ncbi:MAG: polysaccharide deacetylase family protein [Proteobacteria bacterium]|nr:polysaccharide deacetylase family protein [Pseudomonadota bacterium]